MTFLIDDQQLPVTSADIVRYTSKDYILTQVLDWVRRDWLLEQIGAEFQPYRMRQHELLMQRGCLLWGSRVVVSSKLQEPILKALHEGHPGVVRMKELAQSYVWWPKLDQTITEWVARCLGANRHRRVHLVPPLGNRRTPRPHGLGCTSTLPAHFRTYLLSCGGHIL